MTARTLVRERAALDSSTTGLAAANRGGIREITAKNVAKVTRFREGGLEALEREVKRLEREGVGRSE